MLNERTEKRRRKTIETLYSDALNYNALTADTVDMYSARLIPLSASLQLPRVTITKRTPARRHQRARDKRTGRHTDRYTNKQIDKDRHGTKKYTDKINRIRVKYRSATAIYSEFLI